MNELILLKDEKDEKDETPPECQYHVGRKRTKQQFMSIKELANVLSISDRQIRRIAKKLYPEKLQNGKVTLLNEDEVIAIKSMIGTGRNDLSHITKRMENEEIENLVTLKGTKQQVMTAKEVAGVLNISYRQIIRIAKRLYPEKICHGKITYFTEDEVIAIKSRIGTGRNDCDNIVRVKNIKTHKEENDINSTVSVITETIKQILQPILQQQNDLKNFFEVILQQQNKFNMELLKRLDQIETGASLQLEYDYYSLKAYCIKTGIKRVALSEMRKWGKRASILSRRKGTEIRKVPDEQFGQVNSYHISVLQEIFGF